VILAAGATFAGVAKAQTGYIKRPGATREPEHTVSPMLGLSSEFGVEAGLKADVLLSTPAFVSSINDAVFLEGAVFVALGHVFVSPLLRWDFNLHPQWTVYGEAGIEAILGSGDDEHGHSGARLSFAPGAIWHPQGKSYSIRGEVDMAHGAARAGPMFVF
jgi:hypothetical protein